LMLGSRALTHPQDANDPEQLKRILARLAGDPAPKADKHSPAKEEEVAPKPFDTPHPVEPSPYLDQAKPVQEASKEANAAATTVLPNKPQ
jgi:hypothetical protein